MPDLIYPRTIQVLRSNQTHTAQDGLHMAEVAVLSGLPASIQLSADRSAATRVSPGPTDTNEALPVWNIFIPMDVADLGQIQKGDKIVDDLGNGYTVEAPYWNILGHRLSCRYYNPTGKSSSL